MKRRGANLRQEKTGYLPVERRGKGDHNRAKRGEHWTQEERKSGHTEGEKRVFTQLKVVNLNGEGKRELGES